MATADQVAGCLVGLALGDAHGAPHEGGPLERLLWRLMGTTKSGDMRWTDDTQMSLDIAESLIDRRSLDQDDIAARFARSYRYSRGYGPGAAKILKRVRAGAPWRDANRSVYAEGSLGNGGAMRAPVVGAVFAGNAERVIAAARATAEITHSHPLGIEGAVMIATATAAAVAGEDAGAIVREALGVCKREELRARLNIATTWLAEAPKGPEVVRKTLGTSITVQESCVTALYIAAIHLRSPFQDLLAFTATCGGDVDTIGAMAGAIWGASNGAHKLPEEYLMVLEDRDRITQVAERLYDVMGVLRETTR